MEKKMIYIESDSLSVYFHLALEYYLTTEKQFDESTVLLFWRTSPTLVVGKYQNTLEEINRDYAEEKGINIIRRLSGGGTVYYDEGGWQYSFITKTEAGGISFGEYMKPVIDALADLGVKAEFTGRNDIVVDGRKVSGTAQYKHNGYTVHHGTLLYDVDLEELVKSTTVDEQKIISKGIKSVRDRVTNLAEHMKTPIGSLAFRDRMVNSLMGDNFDQYKLTEHDILRINEIAKEKFDNWECKFGTNPPCSIIKKGRFEGGEIELHFDVKKGKIEKAVIYGDFFGEVDKTLLEQSLIGCECSKAAIGECLRKNKFEQLIYKISVNDIVELI